jgi:hypothetical protein
MSQSLLSGVTGLMAHQRKLDVVANNLANLNTGVTNRSAILFSDLGYANCDRQGQAITVLWGARTPNKRGLAWASPDCAQPQSRHPHGDRRHIDLRHGRRGYFHNFKWRTAVHAVRGLCLGWSRVLGGSVEWMHSSNGWVRLAKEPTGNPAFQTQGNTAIRNPLGCRHCGSKHD